MREVYVRNRDGSPTGPEAPGRECARGDCIYINVLRNISLGLIILNAEEETVLYQNAAAADAFAAVGIGRCAIRDVCATRNLPVGGDVCRMFHHYLAGMASELLGGRPVRTGETTVGERCSFRLECR